MSYPLFRHTLAKKRAGGRRITTLFYPERASANPLPSTKTYERRQRDIRLTLLGSGGASAGKCTVRFLAPPRAPPENFSI